MNRGLIFYDQSADLMDFDAAAGGSLGRLGSLPAAGRRWTHFVPGTFFNTNFSGLLLYESASGSGQFHMPNYDGRSFHAAARSIHTGWRTSWTQILAGNFSGAASGDNADLLFYDPASGTGEFYRTTDDVVNGSLQIQLHLLRTHTGWLSTWTQIVAGNFGGDGLTDLLFYNASEGMGVFYTVESGGRIRELTVNRGWRGSWKQIVPGNFGGSSRTDLLFYDPTDGTGEFYTTDQGRLQLLQRHGGWRRTWHTIVPGDFSSNGRTSLLFYDAAAGTGEFYETNAGRIGLINRATGWNTTWSHIVAFDSEIRAGGEL